MKRRRRHHAADPKRSARLRRLGRALVSSRAPSSLDLIRRAGIVALSAAVDELRKRGWRISCTRKGEVWRYTVERRGTL